MIEREIKLEFASAEAALTAIQRAGGLVRTARRLQRDAIFDTADGRMGSTDQVIRLRDDGGHARLTVKGPVDGGAMKVREEHESAVDDGGVVAAAFAALGLHIVFRYEKYRTEFTLAKATMALDETPIGVFVEVEGEEAAVMAATHALGRTDADFVRESYRSLFLSRGGPRAADMAFPRA